MAKPHGESEADLEVVQLHIGAAAVLGIVSLVLWLAFGGRVSSKVRKQQHEVFSLARRVIADGAVEKDQLTGQARDRRVTYRLVSAIPGDDFADMPRTEVLVSRSDIAIVLAIRPQSACDERTVREGNASDIVLGDAGFDAAYLVEAAPEAVVREALDAQIRARLLAMHPATVETTTGGLKFAKYGWIEAPGKVEEAIELTLAIAASLERALGRIVPGAIANAPSGYRSAPSAQSADEALAGAAKEVAALEDVRKQRSRIVRLFPFAAFGGGILLTIGFVLLVALTALVLWAVGVRF